ncbi:MAG: XdhC family protein [Erythrobacter sp.]|nr:XdhC family protein [Erythrobacter sp.]
MDLRRVLEFLDQCRVSGQRAVLVTVCAVEGSSMRNPGTIMGVAADGRFAGSLSGGCIENAVVSEALEALKAGAARVVRYGRGSSYVDIRLPCGGGLDLQFCPLDPASRFAADCLALVEARSAFSIEVGPEGARCEEGWSPACFDPASRTARFGHWPAPLLQITGHGAGVSALAQLAQPMGCEVRVLTPDERIIAALREEGLNALRLERRTQSDLMSGDPWTAFVFLFHDHDWEIELMHRALGLPHFYLGAMGGMRAHEARCAALRARAISEDRIAAIRSPIGLFHSSRDPHTLALSTLAEIIRTYQRCDFTAAQLACA